MILWTTIMMNILNVDINCRTTILESNDMWNDVHMNKDFHKYLHKYSSLYGMMFHLLNKYDDISKTKLYYWNEIITNPFTESSYKAELNDIFFKTQKCYGVLNRFFIRCKINSMKPKIKIDMEMNEISLKPHLSMKIYQDGTLYYFMLRDLINICKSALLYSVSFFNEPYLPKNPYTNNEFPVGVLLNIYTEVRNSNYEMPILLQLLYKASFNIDKFLENNEYLLREEAITDFVKNSSACEKLDEIMDMLDLKSVKNKCKFDPDFPTKTIIKAFEPLLYFYIVSEYSMRPYNKRVFYRNLVQYKILQFANENPPFGRKIMKSVRDHDTENNVIKVIWQHIYNEEFQPINPAQFPTTNVMFRYIIRHGVNDDDDDDDDDNSEIYDHGGHYHNSEIDEDEEEEEEEEEKDEEEEEEEEEKDEEEKDEEEEEEEKDEEEENPSNETQIEDNDRDGGEIITTISRQIIFDSDEEK